jgi:DNA invertase Pin-like site-specific DNA recombinase
VSGSIKIQPTHLERQAVVYLRQSTPKQVLHNQESAANQRALQERLLELGWKKHQVTVIDEDQGQSGKQAAGREGFQRLVADVGLRKVGIVMGYEASRLSRNCADWYRLLELCALFDTLIADADGIYHPRDFNDRLLLGLKGTMSEAELHSLRLRLDAGRVSKAKRGELIQQLPTGYVRDLQGVVHLDPDQSVRDRIRLIFDKFLELGSAQKVLRYLVRNNLKVPRRQIGGPHAGELLWKKPCLTALGCILKNPTYAGAFAHGRRLADPSRQVSGRPGTGRLRQPEERWLALVKDVYPAYISWAQYEQIQEKMAENWKHMREHMTRCQGNRKGSLLLPGLVRCGHCGHAMRVAYKGRGIQYVCSAAQSRYAQPSCQFLSGRAIDDTVVQEFFNVLQPAEIDALERVNARQAEHQQELVRHLTQEVRRLEYAAGRAERQYNCVDPENRLIAATLEKKWESALAELEQAKLRLAEAQTKIPRAIEVPPELRTAFADVGKRLPEVWSRLSVEARRKLLRTLVKAVNLRRDNTGMVQVRIVWQGDLVTEKQVRVPMHSFRFNERERQIVTRIGQLIEECRSDAVIAERLNKEGYWPCRGGVFTAQIVLKLRCRHRLPLHLAQVRAGNLPEGYTLREIAEQLGVDASWFYHRMGKGQIKIKKHPRYGCYIFPRNEATIQKLKQLKSGKVCQVSFPRGHRDG